MKMWDIQDDRILINDGMLKIELKLRKNISEGKKNYLKDCLLDQILEISDRIDCIYEHWEYVEKIQLLMSGDEEMRELKKRYNWSKENLETKE
jgi:hypothetical protein